MENEFFLNAPLLPPQSLHFESVSSIPTWPQLSSAMEIQASDLNCSSDQSPDCFYNYNSFDSALSSMVSSPAASNSNISGSNETNNNIRELIGKLGNIGRDQISPHSHSRHLLPPNCLNLMKGKLPILGKPSMVVLADFSPDPGFSERAAKFSCFGSRSFDGRSSTTQFGLNSNEFSHRSNALSRVSSSPSLKALGGCQPEMPNSIDESTVSEQVHIGETGLKASYDSNSRKRKPAPKGKSKVTDKVDDNPTAKRSKQSEGNGNESGPVKEEEAAKGNSTAREDEKQTKSNSKPPEAPKDYIHVRARRGQATDSHSLAERVRREKISERMKLLQDLVPGCNKVTGKALMLDEIINYVQSLQRQVEFLSMKLASVNTRLDFSPDNTPFSKEPSNVLQHPVFPIVSTASTFCDQQQTQQNPVLDSNISNGTTALCSVASLDTVLCQAIGMQLPPLNAFSETGPQYPRFTEDDLQSIVEMGFGQNPSGGTALQLQSFVNDPNQACYMKMEN